MYYLLSIILIVTCIPVFSQLKLRITNVIIEQNKIEYSDSNSIFLKINYEICNKSDSTIRNFNPLWYYYPERVSTDFIKTINKNINDSLPNNFGIYNHDSISYYNEKLKQMYNFYDTTRTGIGNTTIILHDKESYHFNEVRYFIEMLANWEVVKIKRGKCYIGKTAGIFYNLKKGETYLLQMEYNSIDQNFGSKKIWRGKILSNELPLKIEY